VIRLRPLSLACCLFFCAVAASAAPARVATLVPWVGDALLAVPEKVTLVATTRRFHGAAWTAGSALDLGDGHAPNLEILAAADPDLVVADRRWHSRLAERLAASGGEVLWIEADSVAATFSALAEVGRRVGGQAEIAQAVAATRGRLADLASSKKTTALALFGAPGSFLVISDRTWLGDLLGELGFETIVPGENREALPGYLAVSDEFLASVDPEVVLVLAHGDPAGVSRAFEKEWNRVRARSPRVVTLDPELFATNPGLRLAEAAAALVAAARP
jgi:iron complex transport system substrate-binding protein